jgi:hypothetical protein
MATTSIIQVEDGCYVIYHASKIRGKMYNELAYVSTITTRKEDNERVVTLVNRHGTVLEFDISLKNLWHVGRDHSKCKKHEE